MAHDVFISYSTDDQKIVEGLSAWLEQNGIRCFVAYRDIPKGVVWAEMITEAIENCKLMIVVFSEHFNHSKQVDREIEMCIEEGKPILTFKIQNTEFKGSKKYYLKNLNWIDAFPNPKEYFGELLKSVQSFLPETKKEEVNKPETAQATVKKNNLLIIACIVIACILLSWLLINKMKTGTPVDDAIETISYQPDANKNDSVIPPANTVLENKIEKKQAVSTPEKPKETPSPEMKRITFTEAQIFTTASGEKMEAAEGDILDGEFENGKIVRGKLYDKDKNVKKIIFPKRNH